GGAARLQLRGVRQQRGPDAPGAAPQPQPGAARPQEAVLELSNLCRGQTQEALPLPAARPESAHLRPLGLAPDRPGPPSTTSVKFPTCGLRRSRGFAVQGSQPGRALGRAAQPGPAGQDAALLPAGAGWG